MIRLLSGDCRDVLATLAAESVQCVVTSPPYYGLRDYGTAVWAGGDVGCDHGAVVVGRRVQHHVELPNPPSGWTNRDAHPWGNARLRQCACGAVRVDRQIGLEATPDEYLATMVGVFRQIRRVMRPDAVAFINMGDSYSDKQLLLMPARLALALQADGWWVRSDIIWAKPNPMPESVTDRPTSAHEHVFLLTRSARYFYDADAVRETSITNDPRRPYGSQGAWELDGRPAEQRHGGELRNIKIPGGWDRGDGSHGTIHRDGRTSAEYQDAAAKAGRNLRNVWTIATHAYPEAHFATFPPELAERCVKAGTSERGCCAACGKPLVRVTEQARASSWEARKAAGHVGGIGGSIALQIANGATHDFDNRAGGFGDPKIERTTGWAPGCQCGAATVPCTVLDPFAGAGTTLLVADRLQRDAIGIELNTAYTEMAMERCRQDAPLFTSFPPAEPPEDERMADLFAGDEYERRPTVVSERADAFRNSGGYVNQGPQPSNGLSDMAAD